MSINVSNGVSQLRPDTAMIRSQVPQKDPGRPALITIIAKVQAPQGGETPVPSAPQLGISGSGYGLGYRCLEHYGPEMHMLDFPEGGL